MKLVKEFLDFLHLDSPCCTRVPGRSRPEAGAVRGSSAVGCAVDLPACPFGDTPLFPIQQRLR